MYNLRRLAHVYYASCRREATYAPALLDDDQAFDMERCGLPGVKTTAIVAWFKALRVLWWKDKMMEETSSWTDVAIKEVVQLKGHKAWNLIDKSGKCNGAFSNRYAEVS
ncbi:hypothetical protein NDU88_002958 [Pleurodeles waltl]|uniref:Uncharacterized protein n=1 Tax=Pleurodeles waltl TaxID=8319 RepID=A0AAV7WTY0_PLEWA|nr:hypothetical protein NDU88_002958 [Pleurodeles waltl]